MGDPPPPYSWGLFSIIDDINSRLLSSLSDLIDRLFSFPLAGLRMCLCDRLFLHLTKSTLFTAIPNRWRRLYIANIYKSQCKPSRMISYWIATVCLCLFNITPAFAHHVALQMNGYTTSKVRYFRNHGGAWIWDAGKWDNFQSDEYVGIAFPAPAGYVGKYRVRIPWMDFPH
jgi:hypothetical protein